MKFVLNHNINVQELAEINNEESVVANMGVEDIIPTKNKLKLREEKVTSVNKAKSLRIQNLKSQNDMKKSAKEKREDKEIEKQGVNLDINKKFTFENYLKSHQSCFNCFV